MADISTATAVTRRMTYTEFLDESPMSPFLWLLLIGCIVAQILDGFNFQSTSFVLPLVIKEFGINQTQAGALGTFTNLGLMFGALIAGPISDRIGRRPMFQAVVFTYAFGTLLSALSHNYGFLLAARFVTGLGIGGEFPVVATMLAEFAPKNLRHVFVGMFTIGYSLGWFVCAAAANLVVQPFGWRALYLLGVAPALLILYVRAFIPESVRFLLDKGRVKEAGDVVQQIARRNKRTDVELVLPPASQLKAGIGFRKQYSMLSIVAVPLIVLAFFHMSNNVQVVGFQTWLPSIFVKAGFTLTKSFKFTMIVLAVTPLGQLFAIWLQDKMPRKWAMMLLSATSALCFVVTGLGFEFKYPIAAIIACYVGYQFFSGGVSPILSTLATEIFPTKVRSLAYGILSACARIGSATGPLILGFFLTLGTEIHQIIYYFALPLVVAAVVVVIFIKTDLRHKGLEEAVEA